jgi:rare lipoprotein A
MKSRLFAGWLILGSLTLLIAGCGGNSVTRTTLEDDGPADVVPKAEPKSKYGNMASYVVLGQRYHTKSSSKGYVERGLASWYGGKFHGRRTSSGEIYDMHKMTAAHKTLPLPSYVQVTNLENHRSAIVRVNDRGPFHGKRVIDLSQAAAKRLGILDAGTARVEIRSVDPRDHGGPVDPAPESRHAKEHPPGPFEVTTSAPDDQLYLQVGAFDELTNAEDLRHRLLAYVPGSVDIRPSAEAEIAPYKVRVGPLNSRAEAEAMSRHLHALGVSPGVVVLH